MFLSIQIIVVFLCLLIHYLKKIRTVHTSEPIKITQATASVFKIEYLDINICKSKKNSFKILLVAQAEFDSLFLNSLEHLS